MTRRSSTLPDSSPQGRPRTPGRALGMLTLLPFLLLMGRAWAQPPAAPAAQPAAQPAANPAAAAPAAAPGAATTSASPSQDRLIVGADGATLTGTNGGGGGDLAYLHQFSPAAVLGVGGEYQYLAGSHWEFGSLLGSYSHALSSSTRWNLSGEVHEGQGEAGTLRYGYAIEALAAGLSMPGEVTLSAEERQIDVDTSHGSLPKIGLSKAWGPHWLTSASYAQSTGGNLATRYGLLRVDFFSAAIDLLGGGSIGRVTPAVINIEGVLLPQARQLTEVFFGLTRPGRRADWTLLADQIDLAGIRRFTLTLTATLHFR